MTVKPKNNAPKFRIGEQVTYLGVFSSTTGTICSIQQDGVDNNGYNVYRYTFKEDTKDILYNEKRLRGIR